MRNSGVSQQWDVSPIILVRLRPRPPLRRMQPRAICTKCMRASGETPTRRRIIAETDAVLTPSSRFEWSIDRLGELVLANEDLLTVSASPERSLVNDTGSEGRWERWRWRRSRLARRDASITVRRSLARILARKFYRKAYRYIKIHP